MKLFARTFAAVLILGSASVARAEVCNTRPENTGWDRIGGRVVFRNEIRHRELNWMSLGGVRVELHSKKGSEAWRLERATETGTQGDSYGEFCFRGLKSDRLYWLKLSKEGGYSFSTSASIIGIRAKPSLPGKRLEFHANTTRFGVYGTAALRLYGRDDIQSAGDASNPLKDFDLILANLGAPGITNTQPGCGLDPNQCRYRVNAVPPGFPGEVPDDAFYARVFAKLRRPEFRDAVHAIVELQVFANARQRRGEEAFATLQQQLDASQAVLETLNPDSPGKPGFTTQISEEIQPFMQRNTTERVINPAWRRLSELYTRLKQRTSNQLPIGVSLRPGTCDNFPLSKNDNYFENGKELCHVYDYGNAWPMPGHFYPNVRSDFVMAGLFRMSEAETKHLFKSAISYASKRCVGDECSNPSTAAMRNPTPGNSTIVQIPINPWWNPAKKFDPLKPVDCGWFNREGRLDVYRKIRAAYREGGGVPIVFYLEGVQRKGDRFEKVWPWQSRDPAVREFMKDMGTFIRTLKLPGAHSLPYARTTSDIPKGYHVPYLKRMPGSICE